MAERSYEAFISYRHHELEATIAEAVSRMMENHYIPGKKLRQKHEKKRLGELFRDKDELPFAGNLNDSIKTALRSSRKFIAVLGHDFLDSAHWCVYELEYFLKHHSPDDVLLIVVDGSLPQCLPPQLMRKDEDGKPIEPFVFDLTAQTGAREKIRHLKNERLRLLAGILDENYGEVYNRAKRRRNRRILATGLIAAAAAALTILGAHEVAANQLEARKSELRLLEESARSDLSGGDRLGAIRSALLAYEQYLALYPQGDAQRLESIGEILESSLSFGSFEALTQLREARYDRFRYFDNDRYILCRSGEREALILDAATGAKLQRISYDRPNLDNTLRLLDVSPSNEYLLTGFGDYTAELMIWRLDEKKKPTQAATLSVDENFVSGGFLSDSEIIFARVPLMSGESAQVWDFVQDTARKATGEENAGFTARFSAPMLVDEVAVSPNGRYAFVSDYSGGKNVQVLNCTTGQLLGELSGANIYHTMSENGKYIIAGNTNGFCAIFSTPESAALTAAAGFDGELYEYPTWFITTANPPLLQSAHLYDSQLYPAAIPYLLNEPSGRFYAMVYPDSYVEVFDMDAAPQSAQGFQEHVSMISCVRMSENYLVTAGYDGKLVVWDLHNGRVLHSLDAGERIPNVSLDHTGSYAIVATEFGSYANVYHLESGRLIFRLNAEPDDEIRFDAIGFTADGTRAVAEEKSGRMLLGELFRSMDALLERAREISNISP